MYYIIATHTHTLSVAMCSVSSANTCVSMRQRMSACVSVCPHASAYVRMRQRMSAYVLCVLCQHLRHVKIVYIYKLYYTHTHSNPPTHPFTHKHCPWSSANTCGT